jgi:hypothetical protein
MAVPSSIPLGVSGTALAISMYAAVSTRRRDRRDLYLKMQQHLIEPEQLEGRRLLFAKVQSVDGVRHLREERQDDYDKINRSLSTLEQFGSYVNNGWISRSLVLREWGHTYAAVWSRAGYFVEDREAWQESRWSGWPHLRSFGDEATEWVEHRRWFQRGLRVLQSRVRRLRRLVRGGM